MVEETGEEDSERIRLTGDGAIATGGSKAVGAGGVLIEGGVSGPVIGAIRASGSATVNVHQEVYTQLSEVEEERERQESELGALRQGVAEKLGDLKRLVTTAPPVTGNPYLFLQPFGFKDAGRFSGRRDALSELLARITESPVTFVDGSRGVGKTSLMRAGLAPSLLAGGHLPLAVTLGSEDIETAIKKEVLPNLDNMSFLKAMPLAEFIRRSSDCLPEGNSLVLWVDDFEQFFKLEDHIQQTFRAELMRCVNGAAPQARWLFCLPTDLANLFNFFRDEFDPRSNTYSVLPLDRSGALEAITGPASQRGIQIDTAVTGAILDALGGENIQPAQLQVVCFMLAGGRGKLVSEWTLDHYQAQGRAEGILREYLDRTIASIELHKREVAWGILAVLSDPGREPMTEDRLTAIMQADYGAGKALSGEVLAELEDYHLVEHDEALHLASESLRPRIERWIDERSVREKMRQEVVEQIRVVRSSSLRGLIGGAIGFVLVNRLLAGPSLDLSFMVFSILLAASYGALTGLLVVFPVDLALASYTGPKKWLAYISAGLSGAFAFALATILYTHLKNTGEVTFFSFLPRAALEGGLWGLVAGVGAVWVLSARQPVWITAPIVVVLCGLVLSSADAALRVLAGARGLDVTPATIALAGAILPFFILLAALIGRRGRLGGWRS